MRQRPFTQPRSMAPILFAAMLVATVFAQPSPTIRGSWAATAGPNQIFQGTWTAQMVGNDPNTAQGTWTLITQSNQIAAQGTWSAVKNARTWSGTGVLSMSIKTIVNCRLTGSSSCTLLN